MTNHELHSEIFDRLPPYYLCEGFLGPDLVSRLLNYAVEHEADFVDSTVGNLASERVNPDWRISRIFRDFGTLKKEIKARFREILPEAVTQLRLSAFELYGTELELVAHGNGAFYNTHIDTAIDKDDESVRVLTAVYYFHAQPKVFSGGNIRLLPLRQTDGDSVYCDISPENDRLLLFPSWVPHRVMPVISDSSEFRNSRFAINCWYRKKKA